MIPFVKAHAYGNDFIYVRENDLGKHDPVEVAKAICQRSRGVGADGLNIYDSTPSGGTMRLFNSDGSRAEVSGNGVRGLAAILMREGGSKAEFVIETAGGTKKLNYVGEDRGQLIFRADMGLPSEVQQVVLETTTGPIQVVALWMGNPQCVRIYEGPVPISNEDGESHLKNLGPALTSNSFFPEGTNVELVAVDGLDELRIWIWERGVGRTESSGTGACAAAVAAASYGGAGRDVTVSAPGGSQRVEWKDDGVYLTGGVTIILDGSWLG